MEKNNKTVERYFTTDKYNDMIDAFECDFSLASDKESSFKISELQDLINNNNKELMRDINLLQELSYKIRHNQILIVEVVKDGDTTE